MFLFSPLTEPHMSSLCELYPLSFEPYLKEVLWGGNTLPLFKGIQGVAPERMIGESWEIAQLPNHCSIVSRGPLRGYSLNQLISLLGDKLLGQKVFKQSANTFPLLVKYIDAHQDLSIQVHPNDELAKQLHGKDARGKTEMWYVINAAPEAYLYCGLKRSICEEEYRQHIADATIEEILVKHQVSEGDVFFLPSGRIHSIGKGCLLAEIQQSSDLTYRIYDFMRRDKDGNLRELHTDWAAKAIDYTADPNGYSLHYKRTERGSQTLVSCEYFAVDLLSVEKEETLSLSFRDESFTILQCVSGSGILIDPNAYCSHLQQGSTLLLPAALAGEYHLTADAGMKLLQTYVP